MSLFTAGWELQPLTTEVAHFGISSGIWWSGSIESVPAGLGLQLKDCRLEFLYICARDFVRRARGLGSGCYATSAGNGWCSTATALPVLGSEIKISSHPRFARRTAVAQPVLSPTTVATRLRLGHTPGRKPRVSSFKSQPCRNGSAEPTQGMRIYVRNAVSIVILPHSIVFQWSTV